MGGYVLNVIEHGKPNSTQSTRRTKKMKAWITNRDLLWFKEMQDEARTRTVVLSTFKQFKNDHEVEITIITQSKEDKT